MKRFAFLPILLLVSAVACDTAPTAVPTPMRPRLAQATTSTSNQVIPLNIAVLIPCAGEVVLLSGELHDLFHITTNDNNFSVKIHDNPQGISGVGQTSGDKYQGTGVTQQEFGGSFINGQSELTFINNFRIIGQGPGNNYLVHVTNHITFNANGVLTADVLNTSVECK